eukprot:TRINITY_DN7010_c0_g1_i1.p1 TRINITY_DN7010_c0_g1~~TRINITY_DN7010_c0_g1_i1.p1  ORF type:complete len:122 (-),score=18.73 TRINITY_DN7010_c0_g1_i1:503-868(-)
MDVKTANLNKFTFSVIASNLSKDLHLSVDFFHSSVVTQEGFCNTNNHHDCAPPDWPSKKLDYHAFFKKYDSVSQLYSYTHWAEALGLDDYCTVTIPNYYMSVIVEAGRVAILTGLLIVARF